MNDYNNLASILRKTGMQQSFSEDMELMASQSYLFRDNEIVIRLNEDVILMFVFEDDECVGHAFIERE